MERTTLETRRVRGGIVDMEGKRKKKKISRAHS